MPSPATLIKERQRTLKVPLTITGTIQAKTKCGCGIGVKLSPETAASFTEAIRSELYELKKIAPDTKVTLTLPAEEVILSVYTGDELDSRLDHDGFWFMKVGDTVNGFRRTLKVWYRLQPAAADGTVSAAASVVRYGIERARPAGSCARYPY